MPTLVVENLDRDEFETMRSPRSSATSPLAAPTPTANAVKTNPDDGGQALPLNFVYLFGAMQVFFIVAFGVFTEYDVHTDPATPHPDAQGHAQVSDTYGLWQDVHVMVFVGFGFLMTFLRSYGFSSLALNFLVGVYAIQWGILCTGAAHLLFSPHPESDDEGGQDSSSSSSSSFRYKIPLHVGQLVEGDFAAATVLITLGAVLGKTSPSQTLLIATCEIACYALNFQLCVTSYQAADIGGTLMIHAFGAYFGLACSWVLTGGGGFIGTAKAKALRLALRGSDGKGGSSNETGTHPENASTYHSDMFAMVGTLFLWVFWPSFVAVLASGNGRSRAIVHTLLSLCASCLSACLASSLLRPMHKMDMVDVQNATLAGGVAIGAVADHYLGGGGALAVGACAGVLSTAGYVVVQPWLEGRFGVFDTCGVHNLHGMPALLGGLVAVVTSSCAGSRDLYGDNVGDVFPAMGVHSLDGEGGAAEGVEGRSARSQALHQLAALVTTLAIALVSGALTGVLCSQEFLVDAPRELFNDTVAFGVPVDGPESSLAKDLHMDVSVASLSGMNGSSHGHVNMRLGRAHSSWGDLEAALAKAAPGAEEGGGVTDFAKPFN